MYLRQTLSRNAVMAGLLLLAGCARSGAAHGPMPRDINGPLTPHAAVAPVGRDERELRHALEEATQSGFVPRFVRVTSGANEYLFSPYSQILRTDKAIIARGYDRMYIWRSDSAKVYWSAQPDVQNERLPRVSAPKIDDALDRPRPGLNPNGRSLCSTCALIWGSPRPRKHADPWAASKDPWQINPDYVYWNPGNAQVASVGTSERRRTSEATEFCNIASDGTIEGCYYYYYSYYSGSKPAPGGGGSRTFKTPICSPSNMPANLQSAFNKDPFAQALAQAIAAANNGVPPHINEQATHPNGSPSFVALGHTDTRVVDWFDDGVATAVSRGYTYSGILAHEELHMWYRTSPVGGGDFPNPLPYMSSFVISPTVTLSDGTVLQFDLLSNGVLNLDQYTAYEHVLIHDDQVNAYGTDETWASLADAMAGASSVTVPGGTAQKVDFNGAVNIIKARNLKNATIKNRTVKRPPKSPTGGCTTSPSSARKAPQGFRVTQSENVGGYTLTWDGVPLPPS